MMVVLHAVFSVLFRDRSGLPPKGYEKVDKKQ
jgi:hypothetical protein